VGMAAKKVEGTELRLTLYRKFVEPHGGKIWVKSEVGAGSKSPSACPTALSVKVSLQVAKVTEVASTQLTCPSRPAQGDPSD